MVSFQKIMEHMDGFRKEQSDKNDKKSTEAIRAGINIRDDFWDDFLSLTNNSTALAELLKVPATKISAWRSRIQKYLDKVREEDEVPDPKKRSTMIRAEKDPFDFDW